MVSAVFNDIAVPMDSGFPIDLAVPIVSGFPIDLAASIVSGFPIDLAAPIGSAGPLEPCWQEGIPVLFWLCMLFLL